MSHIALVLPDLVAGGAQRVMLMLAREFVARGHRVDLVLLQAAGQLLSQIPQHVRVIDLRAGAGLDAKCVFAVRAVVRLAIWIRRERPDAMLSSVTGTNIAVVIAWKLAGARPRLVLREVSSLRNVRGSIRLWSMRLLYPRADVVVALTPTMNAELTKTIGIAASHVCCIPNPVDHHHLLAQSRFPVDHPWFLNKEAPLIISVGRLVAAKDHESLIKALSLVVRNGRARLLIVGEGPERASLEGLIRKLGLERCVDLIGYDPNPWRWMAQADLFVLSSLWEGHPNTLLEALVLACPIVATNYDDSVFEMAEQFGFSIVPPGDPVALSSAIAARLNQRQTPQVPCGLPTAEKAVGQYLQILCPESNRG